MFPNTKAGGLHTFASGNSKMHSESVFREEMKYVPESVSMRAASFASGNSKSHPESLFREVEGAPAGPACCADQEPLPPTFSA